MNNSYDKLTEFYANTINDQNPENKNKTGIPYTGGKGNYLQVDSLNISPTNIGLPIHVGYPNGQTMQPSNLYLLDSPDLTE